jgi:hypothetical protein
LEAFGTHRNDPENAVFGVVFLHPFLEGILVALLCTRTSEMENNDLSPFVLDPNRFQVLTPLDLQVAWGYYANGSSKPSVLRIIGVGDFPISEELDTEWKTTPNFGMLSPQAQLLVLFRLLMEKSFKK